MVAKQGRYCEEHAIYRSNWSDPIYKHGYLKCIADNEQSRELYEPGAYYAAILVKRDIMHGDAKREWFQEVRFGSSGHRTNPR